MGQVALADSAGATHKLPDSAQLHHRSDFLKDSLDEHLNR
jgi:hypothetical protein